MKETLLDLTMSVYKEFQELKIRVLTLFETPSQRISNNWLDSPEVMKALKIGKRKLQSLRDRSDLPFSIVDGKFYYKMSDLENLLESGYVKRKRKSTGMV